MRKKSFARYDDCNFKYNLSFGTIHKVCRLSKREGRDQGKSVHLLFYEVILLFKSAQVGIGCLKITKFERTYFMDGPFK